MSDLVARLVRATAYLTIFNIKGTGNSRKLENAYGVARHELEDEIDRLQRELAEAREFRAILEGHLGAAIDDYNEARRQAFIEAAEITEKQAGAAERAFAMEAHVTPPVLNAAFKILSADLRARAEETKE